MFCIFFAISARKTWFINKKTSTLHHQHKNRYNMVIQQGTETPQAAEVTRTEEVVRKIVVKRPGNEEVYHIGLKAEEQDGTLKINLGDND